MFKVVMVMVLVIAKIMPANAIMASKAMVSHAPISMNVQVNYTTATQMPVAGIQLVVLSALVNRVLMEMVLLVMISTNASQRSMNVTKRQFVRIQLEVTHVGA